MAESLAMLIDVSRCMGCRGCQVACKQWNQLPADKSKFTGSYQNPPRLSGKTWTLVDFIEPDDFDQNPRWLFRKESCFHCQDPTCVTVCPTGAAKQREDGIVYVDQDMCAGCKYCVETCPFKIPQSDPDVGAARKCRMCIDRVDEGMQPACATACPTGAISFGERPAMLALAKKRMEGLRKNRPGSDPYLYGVKELKAGLGVMYLLPENNPELYNLQKNPKLPNAGIFWRWLMGVIPGLAILYGMWRYLGKEDSATTRSGGN